MSGAVDSGAAAPTARRLARRAFSLGAANAFEYAMQFLLPVILVRYLDATAFGQYRLLWLAVATVAAVAMLDMPASLYYFLPRSSGPAKRLYVNQTLAYLVVAGLASGWVLSAWDPWLPEKVKGLATHQAIVPTFVLLWLVGSLLDLLPTVEERVAWQAKAKAGLAALRVVALSLAAVLTRELGPVLLVLLAWAAFKVALLLYYVARHYGLRGPVLRLRALTDQLRYAAPLGAASTLYGLRVQADQWIAATLFSLSMFASFSIAALFGSLLTLFRQSVNYTFLPSMSRHQAAGDISGMLELNNRANVMVATMVCPILAFAFAFAGELVTIVYTRTYADAAPVMRIYLIGFAALVVELASVTMLLRQVVFVMRLNAVTLVVTVVIDWIAAQHFGLAGAAVGSVTAAGLDRIATLRRIALCTGLPLGRLQDWRALGRLMLFAALAGAFAWSTVDRFLAGGSPLTRAAAGAALVAAAYAVLMAVSGWGRRRRLAIAERQPRP